MSAAAEQLARRRVGLLMFNDMELLDFAGPYEVFTTAQRMTERAARQMDLCWTEA